MSAFATLAGKVAAAYEKAGKSKATAQRIGGGVAYKQGVKKMGKKALLAKARAARMRSQMA